MLKGVITVMLQPNVLDVQGQAVQSALKHLGFESVEQVRIGRQIEMILPTEDNEMARTQLKEMAKKKGLTGISSMKKADLVKALS